MRAIFFICFLFSFTGLFGQLPDYELAVGDSHVIPQLPSGVKLLYSNNQELCVVKWRQMNSAIERPWMLSWYDHQDFFKLDSLVLDIRQGGQKCTVDQLVQLNGKIFVIYSLTEQHRHKISVFARELDATHRRLNGTSRKIFEINANKRRRVRPGRLEFALSSDQSRICFMRGFSRDSMNKEVSFTNVLDSGLNEQWQQLITLPYPAGLVKIQNLKVSNDGDAFVLLKYKGQNQSNSTFDIVMTRQRGRSARRYPVQAQKGFVSSAQIELSAGRLVCTGFYSRTGGQTAGGVFFNAIDTETLLHFETASDFDSKLVLQDIHKRDFATVQSKAEFDLSAELNQVFIDHMIPTQDGGFILVGEQRYDYSTTLDHAQVRAPTRGLSYRTSSNLYQPSRFYRGDIIAIKIDAHGVMKWGHKIHKSQDTNDHRSVFSSYMVLAIRDRLGLLFNEDRRNITGFDLPKEKDFAGSRPIIAIVTLNESGAAVRELIYDSVEWPMAISPAMSTQVSANEVLLYGGRFHREQFSRIKFK